MTDAIYHERPRISKAQNRAGRLANKRKAAMEAKRRKAK
jgi:hypothetical protein